MFACRAHSDCPWDADWQLREVGGEPSFSEHGGCGSEAVFEHQARQKPVASPELASEFSQPAMQRDCAKSHGSREVNHSPPLPGGQELEGNASLEV